MTEARTVCGKPKYHEDFGDPEHGDWVLDGDKSTCRYKPQPRVHRAGALWLCNECMTPMQTQTKAKAHWWSKHMPTVGRPKKPIDHGTNAGYFAHRRRSEKPCDECRIAHNKVANKWKKQWENASPRRGLAP